MPNKQQQYKGKRSHLKIGFVLDDSLDRPDGVQQYILTLGNWLRGEGHEVHYLCGATKRRDVPNVHSLTKNTTIRFNGNEVYIPLPASRQSIRVLLEAEQFDVLHVQMPFSPLLAGRIVTATKGNTAIVGTFHVVPKSWFVNLAARALAVLCWPSLRRFDRVLSVSQPAQSFARSVFRLDSCVVPNTIRLKQFQEAKPFESRTKTRSILFVGRLVPRKGCQLLLEAALILKNNSATPPFRLTICGRGPLLSELQQFVDHHKLNDIVSFKGFVSETDKPRYFASADIAAFPSNGGESFGIVLLEAMAGGKAAVLGGNNVGYREILGACPGDVLFDPNDASALAEKLQSLLSRTAMRRHIATWQAQYVKRFDIESVGPQVLEVYNSALRQHKNVR